MRIFLSALVLALGTLAALPVAAQQIDFGDDNSRWSNDGECDDLRFEGPGMTNTPVLDSDVMHDASDCRAAYEAGELWLRAGSGNAATKGPPAPVQVARVIDGINFGTDSGDWNGDGECDDRRFVGVAMAGDLSWSHVGRDASDCAEAYIAGNVRLWDYNAARDATLCAAIDFGDDSGAYPQDYECDDRRFEGPGAAMSMMMENVGGDASDCARLCAYGVVFLRDY